MSKNRTQIAEVEVSKLIHAKWNYKTDGTEEQIKSLAKAIDRSKSCGVLAVREIEINGEIILEVMDGNHRLTALKEILAWDKVPVENFGPISQAEAIILTRQRNEQWFDDDKLKLAHLFVDFVFPEISKEELEDFLPESIAQLDTYDDLCSMEWQEPEMSQGEELPNNKKKISIEVDEEVFNVWEKWKERFKTALGMSAESAAFEFAILEALKVPDETLRRK